MDNDNTQQVPDPNPAGSPGLPAPQSPAPMTEAQAFEIAGQFARGEITSKEFNAKMSGYVAPKEGTTAPKSQAPPFEKVPTIPGLNARETADAIAIFQKRVADGKSTQAEFDQYLVENGLTAPTDDRTAAQRAFDDQFPSAAPKDYRSPNYGIPMTPELTALDGQFRTAMAECHLTRDMGNSFADHVLKVAQEKGTLSEADQATFLTEQETLLHSIWKGPAYAENVGAAQELFRELAAKYPDMVRGIPSVVGSSARVIVALAAQAKLLRQRNG